MTGPDELRELAVDELRSICRDIGCSGLDPKMCKQEPHKCDIIRRLMLAALAGEEKDHNNPHDAAEMMGQT